ncbi:MAG: SLC13 family permease [Halanaerobiaceae bacterium]
MSGELLLFTAVITGTLIMFIWGKYRYDLVALTALLVLSIGKVLDPEDIFTGFSHPAVITVAGVLVVSRALLNAGIVDLIAGLISRMGKGVFSRIVTLTSLSSLSSSFMNNVGALSLFMPVTLNLAQKEEPPASMFLMPLAFASILGGLLTLIGTPPNIIVATFRSRAGIGEPFRMFDFILVGGPVVFVGLLFIITVGWRLIPQREGKVSGNEMLEIIDYLTEVKIPESSKSTGKYISELTSDGGEEIAIVDLIREERNHPVPDWSRRLRAGDILVIKADTEELENFLNSNDLKLVESEKISEENLSSRDVELLEVVVQPDSFLAGRTASSLRLRSRYGINLLGIARQDRDFRTRLKDASIRSGDVLLLQGKRDTLYEVVGRMGCLPLASRELKFEKPRRVAGALAIFLAAVVAAAAGLLQVHVAFMAAVVVFIATNFLSLEEAYDSIEWPVIVLLGSMFPLSEALETTGGSDIIASQILNFASGLPPWLALGVVFVGTMLLSNIVNNAAAAVLMAPIAVKVAGGLGMSPDAFLMGVAVSASCAFLTPLGHQNNTLVMGPGGYRFSDFWRMGLPISVLVTATAVPLLLLLW